jgi:RHH-type rel operon transcriptional repressor/antitoxin RelB
MLAIRLPAEIEKRLERLAKRTGRTKSFYAREAIIEHLDDLEDIYLADQVYARYLRGEEKTISLKESIKRLGFDPSELADDGDD